MQPSTALATALTLAGAAVEVAGLPQHDPTVARGGALLVLVSLPLWIVGQVSRSVAARADQISDAHLAGYQMALAHAEQARAGELDGERREPEAPGQEGTGADPTEGHGR